MERRDSIRMVSSLGSRYRTDLERLLFFNPQQGRARGAIVASVEHFGSPEIVLDGTLLRVATARWPQVQALYGIATTTKLEELVGAILFVRERSEWVTVLHLAVREDHSAAGAYAERLLAMRLMAEVQAIAARIKDVQVVRFFRGDGRLVRTRVRARN